MYGLYEISFPDGKSYIGISSDPYDRFQGHKYRARSAGKFAIHNAIRKYGEKNAHFRVLAYGDESYITALEVAAIKSFGTLAPGGYNLSLGGETVCSKSPVVADKIRASKLLHWQDPDYRSKMLNHRANQRFDAHHCAALSDSKRQQWADPEWRANQVHAHSGRKHSEDSNLKRGVSIKASWDKGRAARIHKMTGRVWVNNSEMNLQLRAGESIPAGFQRGMMKDKDRNLKRRIEAH